MVVVIVRKNYGIDWRQPIELHGRRNPAMWSGELHRRSASAPHRICQDVQSAYLDKESCVSDPGDGEKIRIRAGNDVLGLNLDEDARIGVRTPRSSPSLHQGPFEKIEKAVHLG